MRYVKWILVALVIAPLTGCVVADLANGLTSAVTIYNIVKPLLPTE
jgi:hypothetical protein